MESTWEGRDLPVLDAIVRYLDAHDGPEIPDVETFVKLTGMDPGQVARAVRVLSPRFIKTGAALGGLMDVAIMGVTDEARPAVGQWPSPEVWVERLVQALREAAEHEFDPERKRRLRALGEGLGGSPATWRSGSCPVASRRPWATHSVAADWVPAVTAGITAAAALGGLAIAGLFQGRNQERAETRQRRDRAAEVLAEVRAFLVDASPDRLGFNASPERSPEVLRELGERRDRIRIPLLTLAGSHPSPHIRRLAQQLEVEMANMLHMAGWFVSDLLRNRHSRSARDQANEHTRRRWACSTSSWT